MDGCIFKRQKDPKSRKIYPVEKDVWLRCSSAQVLADSAKATG